VPPEMEISSNKNQIPNKSQAPNFKPQAMHRGSWLRFGFWSLFGVWFLGFGTLPAAWAQAPGARTATPAQVRSEVELVERILAARRDYQTTLEQLRQHYITVGDLERSKWVEEELREFHRINKKAYSLELDVPPPTLQANQNIPDANELFRRAMAYKDKGYGTDYIDNQRRAEILLQQLLTQYPQSDKIGEAAYQLGDLYEGRAFKQYRRAAHYFERAFQWHPNTQNDARLRAARLYDKHLMERQKAIELYRDVTAHDTDPKRIDEAKRRLTELSAKR
jgi:tetratricopeptide (TPR) repeat protein